MPKTTKSCRVKQLNSISCSTKIVNFEKFLIGGHDEISISVPTHKTQKDITDLQTRADRLNNGEIRILGLEERTGKHAVILVKSENLPSPGWAIFDPNGFQHFALTLTDKGKDVTDRYISVTGQNVNKGSNSYNPGYCGIFGIIFMIYFKAHHNNANWLKDWHNFLSCMAISAGTRKCMGTVGVQLAADVINIISKNPSLTSNMGTDNDVKTNKYTKEIYNLISAAEDTLTKKKTVNCKTSGGKKSRKQIKKPRKQIKKSRKRYKNK